MTTRRNYIAIFGLLFVSSTVFATTPTIRCEREIYKAAVGELIKINLELTGITIKLDRIRAMENDRDTFIVALEMTDSSSLTRWDSYRVTLANTVSCKIKSSSLLSD